MLFTLSFKCCKLYSNWGCMICVNKQMARLEKLFLENVFSYELLWTAMNFQLRVKLKTVTFFLSCLYMLHQFSHQSFINIICRNHVVFTAIFQ